MIGDGR